MHNPTPFRPSPEFDIMVTFYTPVSKFSLPFSIHCLWCWKGELAMQSKILKLMIICIILMILMNDSALQPFHGVFSIHLISSWSFFFRSSSYFPRWNDWALVKVLYNKWTFEKQIIVSIIIQIRGVFIDIELWQLKIAAVTWILPPLLDWVPRWWYPGSQAMVLFV